MTKRPSTWAIVLERLMTPGLRNYLFLGVAAMLLDTVMFASRSALAGGLIAALLALPGLLLRWTFAPLLVVLVAFWFTLAPFGAPPRPMDTAPLDDLSDVTKVLMPMSLLAYLIAQYRLSGVVGQVATGEVTPVARPGAPAAEEPIRRPAALVDDGEMGTIALSGVVFGLVGTALWFLLYGVWREGSAATNFTRLMAVLWTLAGVGLAAWAVVGYLRWRGMSGAEGSLYLRDQLWQETRREAERLENWKAWHARGGSGPLPEVAPPAQRGDGR